MCSGMISYIGVVNCEKFNLTHETIPCLDVSCNLIKIANYFKGIFVGWSDLFPFILHLLVISADHKSKSNRTVQFASHP